MRAPAVSDAAISLRIAVRKMARSEWVELSFGSMTGNTVRLVEARVI